MARRNVLLGNFQMVIHAEMALDAALFNVLQKLLPAISISLYCCSICQTPFLFLLSLCGTRLYTVLYTIFKYLHIFVKI